MAKLADAADLKAKTQLDAAAINIIKPKPKKKQNQAENSELMQDV